MMKIGEDPTMNLTSMRFTVFSSSDIRKMSVAKIVTSTVFDSLGQPLPGGLYDSAMGASINQSFGKFGFILMFFFAFRSILLVC